ncbi:unnamed protein product [Callosobruchus maculatus]|uniref:Uncharacterized protein n=1 Tax=Callosobruchus maculatus TaxID=64391 RepID=A0A653C3D0_CALMS|nr:unnamed protein product [Callosobruchus maculatus]
MAEDLDVEAMLEAPFKKDTYEVYFGLSRLQHYTDQDIPNRSSHSHKPITRLVDHCTNSILRWRFGKCDRIKKVLFLLK